MFQCIVALLLLLIPLFGANQEYDLVQRKDAKGIGTQYYYKKGTTFLIKKVVHDGKKVLRRYFYEYSDNGTLSRIVMDSGSESSPKFTLSPGEILTEDAHELGNIELSKRPEKITYPDSTYELFKYDSEGSLHRYRGRDGIVQVFEYDGLGRLTHIEYYKQGCNGEEEGFKRRYFEYDAFHLIAEIDENNQKITYHYDSEGRLVTIKKGKRRKEFIYDSLGRLYAMKCWKNKNQFSLYITDYDRSERCIEDEKGNVLFREEMRDAYVVLEPVELQDCWSTSKNIGQGLEYTELGSIDEWGNIIRLKIPSNPNVPHASPKVYATES